MAEVAAYRSIICSIALIDNTHTRKFLAVDFKGQNDFSINFYYSAASAAASTTAAAASTTAAAATAAAAATCSNSFFVRQNLLFLVSRSEYHLKQKVF